MPKATAEAYPVRYNLWPEEVKAILYTAKRQGGGLYQKDLDSFASQYHCSRRPINKVIEQHKLKLYDKPKPKPAKKTKEKNQESGQVIPLNKPKEDPKLSSADMEELWSLLETERLALARERQQIATEKAEARAATEEAQARMRETAALRKKTAEERHSVADLKETIAQKDAQIEKFRQMAPIATQYLIDLKGMDPEGDLRDRFKSLHDENVRLREALSNLDGVILGNADPKEVEYLPLDALEPMLVAIYTEMQRRAEGGRARRRPKA